MAFEHVDHLARVRVPETQHTETIGKSNQLSVGGECFGANPINDLSVAVRSHRQPEFPDANRSVIRGRDNQLPSISLIERVSSSQRRIVLPSERKAIR